VGMIRPKITCTVGVPRETDQISRKSLKRLASPTGIRTRVIAVKGRGELHKKELIGQRMPLHVP